MPLYRKKPVVIEAVKLVKGIIYPQWLQQAIDKGEVVVRGTSLVTRDMPFADISTLEGIMTANPGDWIIQGVNGEIYPCKPDIFEKTYDIVEKT